jgi:hypothetical protein
MPQDGICGSATGSIDRRAIKPSGRPCNISKTPWTGNWEKVAGENGKGLTSPDEYAV